ncbi:uncharacterized protein [Procambarus clarkii]|uniref:uncharacterized protein n=1 Tax=Procambarus clarkii TaxID=6728 RepID=UPI001E674B34|nr:uncharacterized protein LOC123769491 isoform X3 [Procambarus clarkii]
MLVGCSAEGGECGKSGQSMAASVAGRRRRRTDAAAAAAALLPRASLLPPHYLTMGAGSSSTSQLRCSVSDEIRSCGKILEDFEKHDFDCASLGGMKTVYKMFHSALDEIKTKCTLEDDCQKLVACTEFTEKSTEKSTDKSTDKRTEKSEATEPKEMSEKQKKEEKTEPTLDSVIDELDQFWEEEISVMDDAAAVFLLKLVCTVRLTLEKALDKIA